MVQGLNYPLKSMKGLNFKISDLKNKKKYLFGKKNTENQTMEH